MGGAASSSFAPMVNRSRASLHPAKAGSHARRRLKILQWPIESRLRKREKSMLDAELENMRRSRGEMTKALGVTLKGNRCRCPFHTDAHPSAGIYEAHGAWKFTCHVCKFTGDVFDVMAKKDGTKLSDFR